MKKTGRRMFRVALLASITMLIAAFAPAANAAAPASMDVVIEETLVGGVATGVYDSGSIPNCFEPTVATSGVTGSETANAFFFSGEKLFTCTGVDAGNSFTISFDARARKCATTDSGSWQLIGGTGDFLGATGKGRLVGTYFGGDLGMPNPGTACNNDGIFDRWTGKIRFAS